MFYQDCEWQRGEGSCPVRSPGITPCLGWGAGVPAGTQALVGGGTAWGGQPFPHLPQRGSPEPPPERAVETIYEQVRVLLPGCCHPGLGSGPLEACFLCVVQWTRPARCRARVGCPLQPGLGVSSESFWVFSASGHLLNKGHWFGVIHPCCYRGRDALLLKFLQGSWAGPAIPHLGIYTKEIVKDVSRGFVRGHFFLLAENWTPPNYPPARGWANWGLVTRRNAAINSDVEIYI